MLAEQLPDLPEAVDGTNPEVQRIVQGIMGVAGEWVGFESTTRVVEEIKQCLPALKAAQKQFKYLSEVLEEKESELEEQEEAIEDEKEQLVETLESITTTKKAIEDFWKNDQLNSRRVFEDAIEKMSECTSRDWYNLKATTTPSTMIKVLADCVCMMFFEEVEWKTAQMFFQNSESNANQGDLEALVEPYDVKIIHLLKTYDIYQLGSQKPLMQKLSMKVYDPQFSSANNAFTQVSPAASACVAWARACFLYAQKAGAVLPVIERLNKEEDDKLDCEAMIEEEGEVLEVMKKETNELKEQIELATETLKGHEQVHGNLVKKQEKIVRLQEHIRVQQLDTASGDAPKGSEASRRTTAALLSSLTAGTKTPPASPLMMKDGNGFSRPGSPTRICWRGSTRRSAAGRSSRRSSTTSRRRGRCRGRRSWRCRRPRTRTRPRAATGAATPNPRRSPRDAGPGRRRGGRPGDPVLADGAGDSLRRRALLHRSLRAVDRLPAGRPAGASARRAD